MASAMVIDASLMAAFLLREPAGGKFDPVLERLVEGKVTLHVPALFGFEMSNILLMAQRRKRISADDLDRLVEECEHIPVTEEPAPSSAARRRILALARRHRMTVYDAAYLELARRLHAPLLSLDKDILRLKRVYEEIA